MCDNKASDRRERFGEAMKKQTKVMEAIILCHKMDMLIDDDDDDDGGNEDDDYNDNDDDDDDNEDGNEDDAQVMVDNILGHGLDVPLSGLREATR